MTKDPDVAREITYDTMLRNCDGLLDWARRHNYDPRRNASDSHGVTLRHDPYVGFYRSTKAAEGEHTYTTAPEPPGRRCSVPVSPSTRKEQS